MSPTALTHVSIRSLMLQSFVVEIFSCIPFHIPVHRHHHEHLWSRDEKGFRCRLSSRRRGKRWMQLRNEFVPLYHPWTMIFSITSQVGWKAWHGGKDLNLFLFFIDILHNNKGDYIDFQEVDDALRPILEEVAHTPAEQDSIAELCQFVCDQLKL